MQHLRLLGPVRVENLKDDRRDGAQVNNGARQPRFRSRRTFAILGYLVVERRPVAREHLARFFWPDEEISKGRSNLRRELYNLSRHLPGCWQTDPQTVHFHPTRDTTVDVYALRRLEHERKWDRAAELVGGEFLEGIYLDDNAPFETWLRAEREHWSARAQAVLNQACDHQIRLGRYVEALQYGRRLLRLTPWEEGAHRKVMLLLAWTGQREEAMRQYDRCLQALADELAIEPAAETRELRDLIRSREMAIPPTPPPFLIQDVAKSQIQHPPFVVREPELARLRGFLTLALSGQAQFVFVTSGPGGGKTTLMDAFASQAQDIYPDLLVANGACDAYSGAGDAYSPFRDLMAMLTGDVEARWSAGRIDAEHARRLWNALPFVIQTLLADGPQLLDVLVSSQTLLKRAKAVEPVGAPWLDQLQMWVERPPGRSAASEQGQIYEQFTNVLRQVSQHQPLLLILDDMQWIDAASAGLLFHVGRRLAELGGRILFVCGYRPSEIMRDFQSGRHLLAKILSEFKRAFGDIWMSLKWPDEAQARRFVDALIDSRPNRLDEDFRAALFQRTAGHPLFAVELLRAMLERGQLSADDHGRLIAKPNLDWRLLPARVEAVIEERIQQLEPESRAILDVACVEGEFFTAQVVARIGGWEEGMLLHRLAQVLDRRQSLIREQEESGRAGGIIRYRFGHVLFQEFLYSRLSHAQRRHLHQAVARALEELHADEPDQIAVQLARHYDLAGDQLKALRNHALAADHAASIYANQEAIGHYSRAIALIESVTSETVDEADLRRGRGLAYATTGRFNDAINDLELSLQLARAVKDAGLEWRLLIDQGKLWESRDYSHSEGYFQHALDLARSMNDPTVVASSLNWMGNWYANDEEPAQALVLHREALQIFQDSGAQRRLARTFDLLAIAYLLSGDFRRSVASYDRAIEHFGALDDLPRLLSSLMGRAVCATAPAFLTILSAETTEDPLADFQSAVDLARRIGSLPDQAWAAWPLTLLYVIRGDFGQALATSLRGLEMSVEIQHREWTVGNHFARGVLFAELLQPDEAQRELSQGLSLAQELHSRYWINHISGALAQATMLSGDLAAAGDCLDAAIGAETRMDTAGRRYCCARRAELALAQGDEEAALDISERLIATAAGMGPERIITFLWLLKARALAHMGQTDTAIDFLNAAADHAGRSGERFLLWRIHGQLAQLYGTVGRTQAAESQLTLARSLIGELATTIPDGAARHNFRRRASARLATDTL